MIIKQIKYERNFEIRKYIFEKYDIIGIIEELDQRHIPDCYDKLKEMVYQEHLKTMRKGM
ncbi:unnamed protein product [marine sediment metagenome]|uniref:Uncharacterized protein n=1 Tax=marine sediment metagenome TaxID=412755 RepID=X1CK84_9ZZZZ